ncbi:TIGR04283 family arsenosugar biosynthesis glycosyltransferase [Aurantibacter crassamenti]|uniref:TIGR04283 family arsenosugar biosynthesis glycosyltransferase n=1 Tax=Aurantibacter crassamenti TaxID=1837375 RepID=UPI001939FEEE|nr:TIGR04283 family arsenosugar biosynthesis glycosyltransferase [Aurantibacter crassamenti]MBM1104709.1 TIGR04283 family arsenosugar biosynthesis glycosyltransferase [Aurantibacter crassamenti]
MKRDNSPQISVIIPVLNEASTIANLLLYLLRYSSVKNIKEIIVVDGGSTDYTVAEAEKQNVKVIHSIKGRSIQMNCGAKHASGSILYFLHVDTLPPNNFDISILTAINAGAQAGCFRMKFDSDSKFLNAFACLTKLNYKICRGGDQSLFITKTLFEKTGGFNENYLVYEDNEFTDRLYELVDFKILPRHVITSARRYKEKGEVKLQYHFGMMHLKNYMGAGPDKLHEYYSRKIAV